VILQAHAVVRPGTVVVHAEDAAATLLAVVRARQLDVLALEAVRDLLDALDDVTKLVRGIELQFFL
jgi:predicted RNase H-like nuclease (RuvC/YqgF family)